MTRLYVLSMGYIENDLAMNHLLPRQTTVDEPHKPGDWHRVCSLALLISHPKLGWVLIDTGSHPDAETHWPENTRKNILLIRTPEDTIEARLRQLGLTPSDIDLLVLTHLHLDHAGALSTFCNTPAGKHVIVHEREIKEALFEVFVQGGRYYFRSDFVDLPGIGFETVDGDLSLADDLHLICLPGHSAGTMGIRVDLKNAGTFIYTSDAIDDQFLFGPPAQMSPRTYSSLDFARSVERVRWLQRQTSGHLIFGHDLKVFEELRHAPEFYD